MDQLMEDDTQTLDPDGSPSSIQRDVPDPAVERAALVASLSDKVIRSREHWNKLAFEQMREDQAFAAGRQWPKYPADHLVDEADERYVANIVLRHIKQETSAIYGKNPKIVARKKERMLNTIWDGNFASLQMAMETAAAGDLNALALLADAQQSIQTNQQMSKIAKTLELLFQHELSEQALDFKVQMKATVRKALTNGVAYVKLGYQRVMEPNPDVETKLHDMQQQLATIERLSADIADGEVVDGHEKIEELRLTMQAMSKEREILVREGLLLSYPASTAIIPDMNCKQLRGFIGSDWVTEEFLMTADKIKELYHIDVGSTGSNAARYAQSDNRFTRNMTSDNGRANPDEDWYCVWQIYHKTDGLVYTICDGHKDFLIEPAAPDVWLERFYPWFVLVFNEVDDERSVIPPSDVSLIRDMQMDINRARQGLREHRRANRPKTFVRTGALEEDDKNKIENCEANAVLELNGMQPGEKIEEILQTHQGPDIDPRLYDTSQSYEDMQRVIGTQEANLGGTSGATATEVATAEGSRQQGASSTVDDLDEFLTELARAGGQLLLRETSIETVKSVVGPGAVWPEMSREQIAKEITLEIEAASTGRPNQAQEVQTAQQIFPLLMQVPGISPEWLARQLIRRLDDRLDLTEAFAEGLPSVQMMNAQKQIAPAGPNDPNAQGAKGSSNAPDPATGQVNAAPRPPAAADQAFAGPTAGPLQN